jgi:hypothetical protein
MTDVVVDEEANQRDARELRNRILQTIDDWAGKKNVYPGTLLAALSMSVGLVIHETTETDEERDEAVKAATEMINESLMKASQTEAAQVRH